MTARAFLNGRVTLHPGDCRSVLATLPEASVCSVVCDPPYHLTSIVKRFGGENAAPAKVGKTGAYARASAGFMGKQWDGGDVAFQVETWAAVLRVLKPGGHLVAFSGTRTYHRMVCAIEDAGFEIRDQIGWAYGSGFPKSHDVAKAIDKASGIDVPAKSPGGGSVNTYGDGLNVSWGSRTPHQPFCEEAQQWAGWGTAMKPAWEPIVLARKPLDGTVAENVLEHGTGAINIDATRVPFVDGNDIAAAAAAAAMRASADQNAGRKVYGSFENGPASIDPYLANMQKGRWPANIVHDGSPEVLGAFPESTDGVAVQRNGGGQRIGSGDIYSGYDGGLVRADVTYGGGGSAARFFYTAKADADDRLGSKHPTVKPLDLMQWLVRLVTPRGGICLDPFAGTGTTGEAAWREGMRAVLIEREAEYIADIERRMDLAANPTKRAAVAKTKNNLERPEDLPLFSGLAP